LKVRCTQLQVNHTWWEERERERDGSFKVFRERERDGSFKVLRERERDIRRQYTVVTIP